LLVDEESWMKAVVYDQPRSFTVKDVAEPHAGPGEVRLRIVLAGVCGTDGHLHQGEFDPVYPLTPGHEIVGEVDALGEGVTAPLAGQRVVLDNMQSCGTCTSCRRARPAFCASLVAQGVNAPGGFARYIVAPAGKCHPVDDLSAEVAVLAEPTACVMQLDLRPGSDVVVFVFVYGMTEEAAELTVSPYEIFRRELVIKGSFSQAYSFDRAISALRGGRVRTEGIITHRFGLDDYGAALAALADSACIKAVMQP
jgi:threonine dehydrogenase-like Zn-dependent dehydrogenase